MGAVGDVPGEEDRWDGIPELVDPDPTDRHARVRRPPDACLLESIISRVSWEQTTPEMLREDGIDQYDGLDIACGVPWGSLHRGDTLSTEGRTVIVRYVEETPDEGHFLDPMLTYDVYTWVDGERRMRSYVVSMTVMEP